MKLSGKEDIHTAYPARCSDHTTMRFQTEISGQTYQTFDSKSRLRGKRTAKHLWHSTHCVQESSFGEKNLVPAQASSKGSIELCSSL